MVAGGSGMAPILCVLRELVAEENSTNGQVLLGGAPQPSDLFHVDEIPPP